MVLWSRNDAIGSPNLADNAPVHSSEGVVEESKRHVFENFPFPPYSPGLSPIEHIGMVITPWVALPGEYPTYFTHSAQEHSPATMRQQCRTLGDS
ncbi:hypothetical protein TNCV_4060891 [Trichonephila clavipes]|nr:hypothetical protein TNCV_4060891 [Trichonephila clavipes]